MAAIQETVPSTGQAITRSERPAASRRFDYLAVVLAGWFIFGMFLDGWAHNHDRVDDTFFTPWHAVLYSGYAALGLFLVGNHFRNVSRGYSWWRALPPGYMPALAGIIVFGLAGAGDFVWHSLFGFEASMEALMSPAHLSLAVGAFLFLTGPIRAYWSRQTPPRGWSQTLPLILALTFVVSLLTFFTQYASLAGDSRAMTGFRPVEDWAYDRIVTTGALMHTLLLHGLTLVVIRRWRLPFGVFTLIYTLNMTLMVWMLLNHRAEFLLILPFALGGFITDGLLRTLHPSAERPTLLRLFAFLVPFITSLAYFLMLNQVGYITEGRGLWWAIHMWLGVPLTAGTGGYLLSFLAVPPAIPADIAENL